MKVVPQEETRTVVRNAFREATAMVFSYLIAGLFLAEHVQQSPVTVSYGDVASSGVAALFFVFAASGGVLVFGTAIQKGAELWRSVGAE